MKRFAMVSMVGALIALTACENGGATRTLGISATGTVNGLVYFDENGSRVFDVADAGFAGARVRLLAPGGVDTLFRVTTAANGTFRLTGVPVGTYTVVVDSASAGDTARVITTGLGPTMLTVLPGDSVQFVGSISYPLRTVAEARALAPGVRLFVRAVALHGRTTFSDTTLNFVDATGAMRAVRVRPSAVAAGDSVVLRARIANRLGQRVLDDVTVFIVGPTFIPTAPTISSAAASSGGTAGALDAALVRVLNAQVIDTSTVGGNFQMTMNDASGAVVVILDRAADVGFLAPFAPGVFVPSNRFDVVGVLVPTGAGAWRLKPRSVLDLTLR